MKTNGQTTDGRRVVGGLFHFYDTLGVPLSVLLDGCKKNNFQPDWHEFLQDAINHGWEMNTAVSRIQEAIQDCDGPSYWKQMNESHLQACSGCF